MYLALIKDGDIARFATLAKLSFKNKYIRGEDKYISKINAVLIMGLATLIPKLTANSDKEFNAFKSALNPLKPFYKMPSEHNFCFDFVNY